MRDIITRIYHKFCNQKLIASAAYRSLTPKDNIDYDNNEYFKAMEYALTQPKIKNIALAGPYGSGKSSIIDTFISHNPELHILKISMATFVETINSNEDHTADTNESDSNNTSDKNRIDFKEKEIEEWILKQLFYKVSWKKIPQSRFHRIHNQSLINTSIKILFGLLFLGVFVAIFFPDTMHKINNLITSFGTTVNLLPMISWIFVTFLCWLMICYIGYLVRYYFPDLRMKKINFHSLELENKNIDDDSVFDKNLDEILYFFESTPYDIIFFEDLDRLERNRIFVHLRQLNTLLNNYDLIYRDIRFVYAVRDDIFTSQDRTKFFDFIIPVIPIINSTNSNEIILKWIKENKFDDKITEPYIDDISPYIDDMRLLQNTFNEFHLYHRILRDNKQLNLNDENMFSILLFKNLYPNDFADIEKEEGIIKQAFYDKNKYVQEVSSRLDNKIRENEESLQKISNESLRSIKEIKVVMLVKLTEEDKMPDSINIRFDRNYNTDDILRDDFDCYLLDKEKFADIYFRGRRNYVENLSNYVAPYIERINYLKRKFPEEKDKIYKEIEIKRKEKVKLIELSLQELINEYGSNFLSENVKANKLLVFLLRNGYINERYADYINYFHANSISLMDKNFILAVKNREIINHFESIGSPYKIIQSLSESDLKNKASFNFSLLDYILSAEREDNIKINRKIQVYLDRIARLDQDAWTFFNEYVTYLKGTKKKASSFPDLIRIITQRNPVFLYIVFRQKLLDEEKEQYVIDVLHYVPENIIEKMQRLNEVSEYISEHGDILNRFSKLEDESLQEFERKLVLLNIKFENFDIKNVKNDLLDFVLNNNLYQISPDMIKSVIAYRKPDVGDDVSAHYYTSILATKDKRILEYVHMHMDIYMEKVEMCSANNQESNKAVVNLLSLNFDNIDRCVKFLHQQEKVFFENIYECYNDSWDENTESVQRIWNVLLQNKKIAVTWDNVESYYTKFDHTITTELVQFVCTYIDEMKNIRIVDPEVSRGQLIVGLIKSKDVLPKNLEKILDKVSIKDAGGLLSVVTPEKLTILIHHNVIRFSIDNLISLIPDSSEESNMDLPVYFAVNNWDEFLAKADQLGPQKYEEFWLSLLKTEKIDYDKKYALLGYLKVNDITEEFANCIASLNLKVPEAILMKVMSYLKNADIKKLMFQNLENLSADDFNELFQKLSGEYKKLGERESHKRARFRNVQLYIDLAERLKEVGYISSYYLSPDKKNISMVIK
ncbi:hypothetical protein [Mitsuokella multacida]|uniref:YobI family P-loop NTPase n=1 Tax=Mitsuokella multacida TaxID=52226 RepID=UPI0024937462|nr:hypothetical protein [Mitsuokella multacida]